ncbi:alpha-ribazole phosphatase [Megasphaera cerevisiae DSM 20462]|jgi:alpha-ribazole phosphatase|uniref:Alpha-ribazole phosphatase n=1 Tax=Megasphaera cerevisiae DSM 20462 TaxID=1122219 RepID=A0A0J6WT26_9FIRM|nr:alpha-ribazole phosphatase [Megasphaera cerevisiae]KMO86665.1 alpha-ribazole phosphatase [Megasphaera cerevisiae DSM 20462]MCI1750471.1 alpha-ribazole phosphatase [Megasphaera cerevisiae]OKY52734.1 alpha-ribazole phosphatase [Megasphaera cerevisiae]SJZ87865.1 alpha-ribazole phosphatase [Megasphaera cerevisiae DSM 20462]
MIKLYLVRHGETEGNVQQWYQGSTDVPLNEHGIEQAACLSRFLEDVAFDGIYSSTLQRARRTAEIVAAPHHISVTSYDELQEIDFGVWEGHTYNEITKLWPGEIEAFYNSDGTIKAHGGESFRDVEKRTAMKAQEILSRHDDGDTIMIVSHGASIRCLLFSILGLEMSRIWCFQQYNTAFNIIEYHGDKNVMTLMNCTQHLEDMTGYQSQWQNMVSL